MAKIVERKINISIWHHYAKVGQPLNRGRWYGYHIEEDTFEPTRHPSGGKIMLYYQKRSLTIRNIIY